MKPALIDTDITSMFFRGNANVVARFQTYSAEHRQISLNIVSYYEILSGLIHRDAQRQLPVFLEFATQNSVLPLTEQSVTLSARIYANLQRNDTPIDDINLLIAGGALSMI